MFDENDLNAISGVTAELEALSQSVSQRIDDQVTLTRKEESSPKNTALYFNVLLESKDLIDGVWELMQVYNKNVK